MDSTPTVERVRRLLDAAGIGGAFALTALPGGGNNRVFRARVGSASFLVKSYFRHPADSRDRLGTEYGFVRFAWDHGIRQVPRPYAMDAESGLGLYEFVEGRKLAAGEVDANA